MSSLFPAGRATAAHSGFWAGSKRRARGCRCCWTPSRSSPSPDRDCGCSSRGLATLMRSGGHCRPNSWAGSNCSGTSATPTRLACCDRSTSTSPRTRAARVSASCCSKRWRLARRCWPAISKRFGPCSTAAESGRLFANGDAADLAAKAGDLLDDPAARASLAALGRATARRYDWSVVAREIVRVYETVAPGAPPVAPTPRAPLGRR